MEPRSFEIEAGFNRKGTCGTSITPPAPTASTTTRDYPHFRTLLLQYFTDTLTLAKESRTASGCSLLVFQCALSGSIRYTLDYRSRTGIKHHGECLVVE